MNLIYILIFIFALGGILLILQALGVFKRFDKNHNGTNVSEKVEDPLAILNGDYDVISKTQAILSLLGSSYFFVQTQGNAGNNYDDQAQKEKFDALLTEEAIQNIKSLGGCNGQYTF